MKATVYGDKDGNANMVTIYEAYESNISLCDEDTECRLYTIEADTWEEIMQIYYANQGWGEYTPPSTAG